MSCSKGGGTVLSDNNELLALSIDGLVDIPESLSSLSVSDISSTACEWCTEIACETSAMVCGECTGQGCTGQCSAAECGECGVCQSACQDSCQTSCQGCQSSCESEQGPTTYGSITSISATSSSISITYTSISGATWYQVAYRRSSESDATYIMNGTSLSCTIEGLDPSTEYVVNYRGATATVFGPFMPSGKSIVTSGSEFNWTYAGINPSTGAPVAGSEKQSGLGVYVTADEWNELVALTNTKRGTSVPYVSAGQSISASRVNLLATALGVSSVAQGTPIGASFFNALKNTYNYL